MIHTIIKIIVIVLSLVYIGLMMRKGYKKAKGLESVCTQIIDADVVGLKKHHFLWCVYYQMECQFILDGITYTIKRGIFENINPNTFKAVQLHINPQNPIEVYYKSLNERCKNGGCCFVGGTILFLILIIAILFAF